MRASDHSRRSEGCPTSDQSALLTAGVVVNLDRGGVRLAPRRSSEESVDATGWAQRPDGSVVILDYTNGDRHRNATWHLGPQPPWHPGSARSSTTA